MSDVPNNVIEKEITINASKASVYDAITNPEKIVAWFPDAIEGSLSVGERPVMDFGEHGKNQIYVVESIPHEYFAYRWVPGSKHFMGDVLGVPNTLVEFFISEEEAGTKVLVKESGFATLPGELAERAFKDNSGGWEFMIGRLQKVFTTE